MKFPLPRCGTVAVYGAPCFQLLRVWLLHLSFPNGGVEVLFVGPQGAAVKDFNELHLNEQLALDGQLLVLMRETCVICMLVPHSPRGGRSRE